MAKLIVPVEVEVSDAEMKKEVESLKRENQRLNRRVKELQGKIAADKKLYNLVREVEEQAEIMNDLGKELLEYATKRAGRKV